jgi:hypothetical protein
MWEEDTMLQRFSGIPLGPACWQPASCTTSDPCVRALPQTHHIASTAGCFFGLSGSPAIGGVQNRSVPQSTASTACVSSRTLHRDSRCCGTERNFIVMRWSPSCSGELAPEVQRGQSQGRRCHVVAWICVTCSAYGLTVTGSRSCGTWTRRHFIPSMVIPLLLLLRSGCHRLSAITSGADVPAAASPASMLPPRPASALATTIGACYLRTLRSCILAGGFTLLVPGGTGE